MECGNLVDSVETGGYYYVGRPYVEAVAKHGGVPMVLAPEYKEESLKITYISY